MSDIIETAILSINGVPVSGATNIRWAEAPQPRRVLLYDCRKYTGTITIQGDVSEVFAALMSMRSRYWARRWLYKRRKAWRDIARQLGIARSEARELCRSGTVEMQEVKR